VIVARPPFCPRCQTPDLIEKRYVISSVATISYRCPRCSWKIDGKDPTPLEILRSDDVRMELTIFPEELPEELDQPAYRFQLTDNGADPLNMLRADGKK